MKYGIFSDVHSNLEAFSAVLDAFQKETVDRYLFLGDIVGYGADPHLCLQRLQELIKNKGCDCVAGNHDHAVCGLTSTQYYSFGAKVAVEWTKEVLPPADMEFLAQLPLVKQVDTLTLVHANLSSPEHWGYIFSAHDAESSFKRLKSPICLIGHTHQPVVFVQNKKLEWFIPEEFIIEKNSTYIINVGSVGQPRDGNPDAAFAIYDTDFKKVEIRRIPYDIARAQKKIRDAGLPDILADRLADGR